MKRLTRAIVAATMISLFTSASSSFADDTFLQDTFKSAFYGGAVGTLVGAALLVFTKKPADHLEYMGYGAAAGVLAGTTFSIAKSASSLATIDNGRIRIAMPTITPDLVESHNSKTTFVTWRADILRGTFH